MANQEIVKALKESRLGVELDDGQADKLAQRVSLRDVAPGETLVSEGTSDNHLYAIVSGVFGVIKGSGTPEQTTLHTLTKGDLAGELSFIDGNRHYASLVALAPSRVIALEREQFESILHSDPALVYCVMRAIVRTVHEIQRRLSMQAVELSNYIFKQHGRY